MKKSEYLNAIQKTIFLLSEERFAELNKGEILVYTTCDGKESSIPKAFLLNLIQDKQMYEYFHKMIDSKNAALKFSYLNGDKLANTIKINVVDAIKCLYENLYAPRDFLKLSQINDKCSIEALLESSKDEYYTISVEDKDVVISVYAMLKLFVGSEQKFANIFKKDNKGILGLDKKEFAYVLSEYLDEREILKRYVLGDALKTRYNKLKQQSYIDFQSINYFEDEKKYKYDVEINKDLKREILKHMNPKYSDLEKSIYIYIKLCKLFSYDPNYYANGQRGESALFHKDLNRISTINSSDDEIVCYEFNTIYSKFLEELNIKYRINTKKNHMVYGKGHANLTYTVGKFIIFADAVTSILDGDLINAKLNLSLNGLKCENICLDTVNEFDKIVTKVYSEINAKEASQKSKKSVKDNLAIYRANSANKQNLSLKTRMNMLIDLLADCDMKLVDCLGYMTRLKKMFFNSQELAEDVNFSIVKNKFSKKKNLVVIITIKDEESKDYNYWYYIPTKKAVPIRKKALKKLVDTGIIESIVGTARIIPGIGTVKKR